MKHLKEAKVGTGIHYPVPLHLQRAYLSLNYGAGDFPVTEIAASQILSLPLFPHLTPAQLSRVVELVLAFTSRSSQDSPEPKEGVLNPV